MDDLNNKVAVITGGSSGIGAATAKLFLDAKMKVVVFDQKTPTDLLENDNLLFIQGDVTKLSDLDKLYKKVVKNFGKIDVLFANAGVRGRQPLSEVTEDFFDQVVSINYKAVYFTVQRSLNCLNKDASVILMSSATGHAGFNAMSVYASTKAAVRHLAKCFATELATRSIRVNSVSPGFVETPIWDNLKKAKSNIVEMLAAKVPLGQRMATAEEIADIVKFLASKQSRYITGEDIIIDGGVIAKETDIV